MVLKIILDLGEIKKPSKFDINDNKTQCKCFNEGDLLFFPGNCQSPGVQCFSSVACSVSTKSARWYHVSDTEHFCNSCFEYFYRCDRIFQILIIFSRCSRISMHYTVIRENKWTIFTPWLTETTSFGFYIGSFSMIC